MQSHDQRIIATLDCPVCKADISVANDNMKINSGLYDCPTCGATVNVFIRVSVDNGTPK